MTSEKKTSREHLCTDPVLQSESSIALYLHTPWCVKKCPYCDFNSHALSGELPEKNYFTQLYRDLATHDTLLKTRRITSVFIGGGTPSLISGAYYADWIDFLRKHYVCDDAIEITLEANPGTVDQSRFQDYYEAGINRLSLGIQSFDDNALKQLGRIHDNRAAHRAIEIARLSGFRNINLDLMHGLPQQSITGALRDLQTALAYEPSHLSWYQLTIEPNTLFHRSPPTLPDPDDMNDAETQGFAILAEMGFEHYEISAFAKQNKQSRHNLNYWRFGDYLGLGAGAHSKITQSAGRIQRLIKLKHPKQYLITDHFIAEEKMIEGKALVFEYLLNKLRLFEKHRFSDFEKQTGLSRAILQDSLQEARQKALITIEPEEFYLTDLGNRFLNDVLALFID